MNGKSVSIFLLNISLSTIATYFFLSRSSSDPSSLSPSNMVSEPSIDGICARTSWYRAVAVCDEQNYVILGVSRTRSDLKKP